MNDFSEHIAALSPKKRALLLRLLEKNTGELNSFPLSFAQQRLWFLDQWKTNRSLYNIPTAMRLKGLLHSALLEQALNEIVQRHEVLRTTFSSVEGQPIQIIAQALDLKLVVIDVNGLPWFRREVEIRRLMNAEAEFPFDLARGPLIRAKLLWIADKEYVLLLTMHHIVSDGWSLEIFYRELSELYNAYLSGKSSPLPALPIQYVDYTVWQRNWLRGKVLEEHLNYWKQQLRDAPAILEMPTNRPRPAVQSFHGATYPLILAKELVEALKALSQSEEVTLFMTMLAAFQILLFRYTGQDDLVIGSPIANRTQTETEHVIGFFVNTLVLRTNLSAGNISFRTLLGRVREVALGAYAHQALPFERLVEELRVRRDLSYSPLFQVAFGLQSGSRTALELAGITVQPQEIENGTTKFDLTLSMIDTKDSLHGALEYNTDLFDATTIGRMAEHYQVLLEGIVSNPEQSLANLPILSKTERERMLFEWNNTSVEYPHYLCAHQLFEAQVERTPDTLAMVMADEQFTYEALNRQANQLARHLQTLGVGPEVLVGISMDRSTAVVIGLLGVLKAGGAYVPLDPAYPAERSAFILHDAHVQVLLTQHHLLTSLPAIPGLHVLCLDTHWPLIASQQHAHPPRHLHPEHLAYVIYTSGSTGQPKGTLLSHRGLSNLALAQAHAFPLSSQSRILQFASLSFDASIWEIVMALSRGALLALATPQVLSAGHDFTSWLHTHAISVMTLPPSVLLALPPAELPLLHTVIAAGEASTPPLVARWSDGHHFFNAYGPTETTVCASIAACRHETSERITIGHPIANMQIYLFDASLHLVPVGVPGELHIGGVGLARGYLQRPDLTAERFLPHPLSQEPGARLYKTGDRARYLPDGSLEFLGRLDSQIKLRGFRIELGEIETVLGQHPAICENIVLIREDVPGEKQLVAYITLHSQRTPTIGDLRTYLKTKLPSYMIPSAIVTLERLPLTPNGKVDRRALPAPGSIHLGLETAYIAPRTPVEQTIAKIWQEVLHVERVGIHDNFFDLGGHSLLLARIHSKLQVAFQRDIPMINLFKYPTIRTLTDYFSQKQTEETSAPHSPHRTDTHRGSMQRQRQIRLKHHEEKEKRGIQNE